MISTSKRSLVVNEKIACGDHGRRLSICTALVGCDPHPAPLNDKGIVKYSMCSQFILEVLPLDIL